MHNKYIESNWVELRKQSCFIRYFKTIVITAE